MNKLITKSDELLLEDVQTVIVDEVIDAIATSLPGINIAYKLAKAYDNRGIKLRQERALEFVEFVRDNLGRFSQKLCEQEEFQDCFALLLDAYIRERSEKKRKLHRQLLLNLTNKNKKELEEFDLERMIIVTNQISLEALNVLDFIDLKLLSKVEDDVQKQLDAYNDREGVEGKRLEDITRARILISDYISKWIYENYNSNSETVKNKYKLTNDSPTGLRHKISYEEHLKEIELLDPLPELANLGILIRKNGSELIGGNVGSGYSLSLFGNRYLDYLNK